MDVKIISKPSFAMIGKMGQGKATEGAQWIPPLWKEANENFHEIKPLAKLDPDGNIAGIWGAMSDIEEKFEKWGEQGKYLSGCEVKDTAEAPAGWTKWVIPAYTYAVVSCMQESYQEALAYMMGKYLPENKYQMVGAVHEFYPQDGTDRIELYFPVRRD